MDAGLQRLRARNEKPDANDGSLASARTLLFIPSLLAVLVLDAGTGRVSCFPFSFSAASALDEELQPWPALI